MLKFVRVYKQIVMSKYTMDQYNKLVAAHAQGVLKVKYADKEVEYRSFDDMARLISDMERDLGIKKPGSGRSFATFDKGVY